MRASIRYQHAAFAVSPVVELKVRNAAARRSRYIFVSGEGADNRSLHMTFNIKEARLFAYRLLAEAQEAEITTNLP